MFEKSLIPFSRFDPKMASWEYRESFFLWFSLGEKPQKSQKDWKNAPVWGKASGNPKR